MRTEVMRNEVIQKGDVAFPAPRALASEPRFLSPSRLLTSLVFLTLSVFVYGLLTSSLAMAGGGHHGGHWGGHGHGRGHSHGSIGIYLGSGFGGYGPRPFYPRPYYPTYYGDPYYYGYPPAVVYQPPVIVTQPAQPPVYVEQPQVQVQPQPQVQAAPAPAPAPAQVAAPTQDYYWYHCDKPEGYYPYVKECPGGWQKVTPEPPK